ncbi:MAG: uridine kinase [Candidatus Calescibacterium sp.]|nr:uridine kinase [Candidatus Calescibacterium sp.]MCX7971823.1 uridine kinase [bacterium]MDW8194938.1 uridine kinase [Candidatus Calescibacterium sp.]
MLVISIAGGSASGKTTVANSIIEILRERNIHDKISILNMDSYYIDLSNISIEQRKKINFDHPDSIDWNLLYSHINDLLQGKKVYKPIYSYTDYTRTNNHEVVYPNHVLIIEGLFALYDEKIRKISDIKIFVEAPDDVRLIRRIYRDIRERGRNIDEIIEQYITSVRPMYVEFIEPTKKYADIIIQNEKSFSAALKLLIALVEKHTVWI